MDISLGVDTGGTYTDAALVDQGSGEVIAAAKALTTRHDLSVGIRKAIQAALDALHESTIAQEINLVALSTTLATNAIVEGYGGRVCLLLIGYDREHIDEKELLSGLKSLDVVHVDGGHDVYGNETAPMDEESTKRVILSRRGKVDAFAISGYFGVRNPGHEMRARALVKEFTGLPATCGSEITTRLNAIRRANTVALNARLIPLLQDLITKVRLTLSEIGIDAPLMVVKGDGSLVSAEWATQRPIETILSGPAASAVGALHLSEAQDVWVVDMGGTTTDIVALENGRPRLNAEGATVGGRQTMVEAIDMHTVGLGGDSLVSLDRDRRLIIGPRRVVPLCLLAAEHPEIVEELRRQVSAHPVESAAGQFVIYSREPTNQLTSGQEALLTQIKEKPLPLLAKERRDNWLLWLSVKDLEEMQIIQRAGFTPTDALHVLGELQQWDTDASKLGAEILAHRVKRPLRSFCEQVVKQVSGDVMKALLCKAFQREFTSYHRQRELEETVFLDWFLDGEEGKDLLCELKLSRPLVAIGGPVEAYLPAVAERLHTKLIIPPHAEVGNAVGAVAGSVVQRYQASIIPLGITAPFRLRLPAGVHDFEDLEQAVLYARQMMSTWAETVALKAGAEEVAVNMIREDKRVFPDSIGAKEIYLGTTLDFTAAGRPRRGDR